MIGYSTAGFTDRGLEAALRAIAAAGFEAVEVSSQAPHVPEPPVGVGLQQLHTWLREAGLTATTVHAPMRENVLGAPEETWRRERVAVLGAYLRFAGDIGAKGLVIHPVPNPIFVPDAERPELTEMIASATRRSLDQLVPVAQAAGVRMLLENLPYNCHYPFLTMPELRALVDGYPDAGVGLVVDTGHAWTIGNDPAAEIRAAGSRLWGTHLQDVDADEPADNHWVPGHGGLDWEAIGGALRDVGYTGASTYEVIVARHGETPEALAQLARDFAAAWPNGPGA